LYYLIRFFILLILTTLACVGYANSSGLNKLIKPAAVEKTPPQVQKPPPAITVANLITYTNRLSKELIDAQNQLDDANPGKNIRDKIAATKKTMESLNWETIVQETDSNLRYRNLVDTMALMNQQEIHLNGYTKGLKSAIDIVVKLKNHWKTENESLKNWIEKLQQVDTFQLVAENTAELKKSIEAINVSIKDKLTVLLTKLNDVSAMQVNLYTMKVSASARLVELRAQARHQTSPSIFNRKFYSQINKNVLAQAQQNALSAFRKEALAIQTHASDLFLILTLPFVLAAVFILNRKRLKNNSRWSMVIKRPFSSSFFLILTFSFPFINATTPQMIPACSIIYILSVMRLAGERGEKQLWVTRFLYILSLYLIVLTVVEIINLPTPLHRIFLLVGSCSLLVYVLWRLFSLDIHKHRYHFWLLMGTCLSLICIIFTGMFGYDELGQYLFSGVFLTIFVFIASMILFKAINIIFEIILTFLPVLQRHIDVISRSLRPLTLVLCVLVFYSITAVIWRLFSSSQNALTALYSTSVSLFGYTLPMQSVFIFIIIVYLTILLTRSIQSILLDEVLPRYNIHKGVQLSIVRLVHYAILTIGCIILLKVMGSSLTKLTIIGGALSVGIGFGLQTIVSNFASGLILLFERPIKVGDTIALGTELGIVKQLGLRSTIIQTFDNAEIVIPNSDLISGQVTNWTLAERQARVKIPVGVAYGSDIEKVLSILLAIADEHPMTLKTPQAKALFLAFGASSLDFELRVWVADFNDRRQVQSDLNLEINSEFTDANIEIPFPQTDLHIRSVDDEAAEALRMPETKIHNL